MGKIHSSHKNKLIDIPTKSGVISLGNIYGEDTRNPHYTKGIRYTWKLK